MMYLCAEDTCAGTEGQVGICNGYIPRATVDGRAWADSSRRPGSGTADEVDGPANSQGGPAAGMR